MGIFNFIEFDAVCPKCRATTTLRVTTKTASTAGPDDPVFGEGTYRIGQRMSWLAPGDPAFDRWRYHEAHQVPHLPPDEDDEYCYGECLGCGASIGVVVHFRDVTPVGVSGIELDPD